MSATLERLTSQLVSSNKDLEIVGLIPQDVEILAMESGSPSVYLTLPLLALCVISREQLTDDSTGSLFQKVGEQ